MPASSTSPSHSIILTGATSGLGLAAARALAADPDVFLILPCRNMATGQALLASLQLGPARASVVGMDLARIAEIRAGAAAIRALPAPPVRALLCNAGMQLTRADAMAENGVEMTFAVNHLAHFLLANLLLTALRDGARIIFTASGTHDPAQKTGIPVPRFPNAEAVAFPARDPQAASEPPLRAGQRRYSTSKLCNVMCAYAMARRIAQAREAGGALADVAVASFDPGLMPGTGLARSYAGPLRLIWRFLMPVLIPFGRNVHSPQTSAANLLRLAAAPPADLAGRYFIGAVPSRSAEASYDLAAQEDLWALSRTLTGLTAQESPIA